MNPFNQKPKNKKGAKKKEGSTGKDSDGLWQKMSGSSEPYKFGDFSKLVVKEVKGTFTNDKNKKGDNKKQGSKDAVDNGAPASAPAAAAETIQTAVPIVADNDDVAKGVQAALVGDCPASASFFHHEVNGGEVGSSLLLDFGFEEENDPKEESGKNETAGGNPNAASTSGVQQGTFDSLEVGRAEKVGGTLIIDDDDGSDYDVDEEENNEADDRLSSSLVCNAPTKKNKKGNKKCKCALAKRFPHRAKKCANLEKVGIAAAAAGAFIGVVAASAVIATNVAEQKHQKETSKLVRAHVGETTQQRKEAAELEGALHQETARRIEAEASLEEVQNALALTKADMLLQQEKASKFELEIEALVKQTQAVRPTFNVSIVLDISGSMAGSKSAEMFTSVCKVASVLHPSDSVSLILFDHKVSEVVPLTLRRNLDFPNCIASVLSLPSAPGGKLQFKCRGATALWDAVSAGLCSLEPSTEYSHLIVLTDGDDNSSRWSSRSVVQDDLRGCAAANAKFQCSFITVGSKAGRYVSEMASLAATHEKFHHYHADNAGGIEGQFQAVTLEIQSTIKICMTVEVSKQVGKASF